MNRSASARSEVWCSHWSASRWRRGHNDKRRRTGMRRPKSRLDQRLRAGVPLAVTAEIGPRLQLVGSIGWIVGWIGLRAGGHGIVVARSRAGRSAVIIVIRGRDVSRPIIRRSAMDLRRDGAADHSAGSGARDDGAAAVITTTAG